MRDKIERQKDIYKRNVVSTAFDQANKLLCIITHSCCQEIGIAQLVAHLRLAPPTSNEPSMRTIREVIVTVESGHQ